MSEEPEGKSGRDAWFAYYHEKRLFQQWTQIHMLEGLDIQKILEVGPFMGFVTALLNNIGYDVTTLDLFDRRFDRPPGPHVKTDLRDLTPEMIEGHDCIICCETLEHLHWETVPEIVGTFRKSGARYLLVSVPYEGLQLFFQLYWNPWKFTKRTAFRKLRSRKTFTFDEAKDPYGHKWEVGYKGYPLKRLEGVLEGAGYRIRKRDFTHGAKSVFFLLEAV